MGEPKTRVIKTSTAAREAASATELGQPGDEMRGTDALGRPLAGPTYFLCGMRANLRIAMEQEVGDD